MKKSDENQFLQMGKTKLSSGEFTDALKYFDQAINTDQKNPEIYNYRGLTKEKLKDFLSAITDYDRAIELNASFSEVYFNRGYAKYNVRNFRGAIADYNLAIKLNSKDAHAYHARGNAYLRIGISEKAAADYNQAIDISQFYAQDPQIYFERANAKENLNDLKGAMLDYDQVLALNPHHVRAHYNRGMIKLSLNVDISNVINDFNYVLDTDTQNNAIAYYHRGNAKAKMNDYIGAIADYDQVIKMMPSYELAYFHRANALQALFNDTFEKDYLSKAMADYNNVLMLNPKNGQAHYDMGNVALKLNDTKRAILAFNEFLKINPQDASGHLAKGDALLLDNNLKAALLEYDIAINMQPNNSNFYVKRANAKLILKDCDGAFRDYEKAIQENPNNAYAYLSRGDAKQLCNNNLEALQDYNQALKINSNDANAYYQRGNLRHNLNDILGAIADYDEAIGRKASHIDAYYKRGLAKQKIHDFLGAWSDFKKTHELNPKHVNALKMLDLTKNNIKEMISVLVENKDAYDWDNDLEDQLPNVFKDVIENLVFSGGGAAGCAYAGAIEALSKEPSFSFEKLQAVAGASIGSVAALIVSLKYTPQEASDLLHSIDLKKFKDGGGLWSQATRLFSDYGRFRGKMLEEFIKKIIKGKVPTDHPEAITFSDLKKMGFLDLYVIADKVYTVNDVPCAKEEVFSSTKTPFTSVVSAVHASAAAPFHFACVRLKQLMNGCYVEDGNGDVFVDGGLLNNYPIEMFDQTDTESNDSIKANLSNPHTLGLILLQDIQIPSSAKKTVNGKINNAKQHVEALMNSLLFEGERKKLCDKNIRDRTIQINRLGVDLADFDIDEKTKSALVNSGKNAVQNYLTFLSNRNNLIRFINKAIKDTLEGLIQIKKSSSEALIYDFVVDVVKNKSSKYMGLYGKNNSGETARKKILIAESDLNKEDDFETVNKKFR